MKEDERKNIKAKIDRSNTKKYVLNTIKIYVAILFLIIAYGLAIDTSQNALDILLILNMLVQIFGFIHIIKGCIMLLGYIREVGM